MFKKSSSFQDPGLLWHAECSNIIAYPTSSHGIWRFIPHRGVRSKFLGGEGVVDGEGGSSERCLKWGGEGGGGGH